MTQHPASIRSGSRLTAGLLLAGLVAGPAGAESLKSGDLLLVGQPDHHYVERADGQRTELSLTPGTRVQDFVESGDHWFASALASDFHGSSLVLLQGQGSAVTPLPLPALASPELVLSPTLLVQDGKLRALGWLEGNEPTQLAVRFARFDGTAWEAPQTVSPPGPGSQMALSAAVLADGSWLLAWSAFDGEDDEIQWSRSQGSSWSTPQRVGSGNQVPDITPRLQATPGGGALLAWSRYDGNDYRLTLSRFDGTSWSEPRQLGPAGATFPTFSQQDGQSLLLFHRVVPEPAWMVYALDSDGKALHQAELPTQVYERPVIRRAGVDGVELAWPAADKAATTGSLRAWQELR